VQLDEQFDYDDFSAIKGGIKIWVPTLSSERLFLINSNSGLPVTFLALEYLRGHIGKKLFDHLVIGFPRLRSLADLKAALLLSGAVFFVLHTLFGLTVNRLIKAFHPMLIYPILSLKEKF
jgi:hypothetical protein